MGCCLKSGKGQQKVISSLAHSYPRESRLSIKNYNEAGLVIEINEVAFRLSEPLLVKSEELMVGDRSMWISQCVLPGQDPRGYLRKDCQDLCYVLSSPSALLVTLYDGHGAQGHKVVNYCRSIAERFYAVNQKDQSPSDYLIELTHHVDRALKSAKNIDSTHSGTTEVLVYLKGTSLYCGSVGDSRAIIATTAPPAELPAPSVVLGEERKILDGMKSRNKWLGYKMEGVQLTRDQKPEDPEEFERISKAGGRVQRLTDQQGQKIGPYRVWEMNNNTPGLAMSRSIGDSAAESLGIISTPIITKYQVNFDTDYFIVAASDGVWDVFENQEVVSFVEFYRDKCNKEIRERERYAEVNSSNACIAQLLCEEARHRWYAIVEQEDVIIDDISCVIVELNPSNLSLVNNYIRSPTIREDEPDQEVNEFKRSPTLKEVQLRDPRRASMVTDKFNM